MTVDPAEPVRPVEPVAARTTPPDLRALVRGASRLLAEAGVPSPVVDARALAAHVLGLDLSALALDPALPEDFARRYAEVVERRRRREPLQHVVGRQPFRYLDLVVEPGVFVPRPETESVAQVAVDEAAALAAGGARPVVVDLCCGAGGLAISVAHEVPAARVHAVDVSPQAVALTRRNAERAGADVTAVVGDVRAEDLLAELAGGVDVVVANPPYIPPDAEPTEPEVRDHDPALALYGGGPDGLDLPRAVLRAAVRLLRPGGLLVCEHAEVQAAAMHEVALAGGGLHDVRTLPDLAGRDRMLVARRVGAGSCGLVEDSPS